MDEKPTVTESTIAEADLPRDAVSVTGVPYPEHLMREKPPYRPGVMRVAVDRYLKQEYHDLEVKRIWKKVWQYAVREEEIPEVGDYALYSCGPLSYIVVRTGEHEFKAYPNSCLHRGRRLCDHGGKRAEQFQCEFHGWAWDIHGKMTNMTCGWDFPGTREEVGQLPECSVGVWGGFVFINPDPNAEPLGDFLGELPDHFEGAGHDFAKRWKQVHVILHVEANWKVAQEAFLEAWHVTHTHPQMLRSPQHKDVLGTRWDDFGNFMRLAPALPTDTYRTPPGYAFMGEDEQQVVDGQWDFDMDHPRRIVLEPGQSAGEVVYQQVRGELERVLGEKIDDYHDVHMFAGEMISIFPNLNPFGGFSRQLYRFRPYLNDPNRCVMDCMIMSPWPEDRPRPPPARPQVLGFGEPLSKAIGLGHMARITAQDVANIPEVQKGLQTSATGYVILSSHNESPVRHFHDLYNKWMGFEDGDPFATWRPEE